jgi:hypothetical protein
MHGREHVEPDYPTNYRVIDTLEKQAKILEEWLKDCARYAALNQVTDGTWKPSDLDEDERAALRVILDTTAEWREEKVAPQSAVG